MGTLVDSVERRDWRFELLAVQHRNAGEQPSRTRAIKWVAATIGRYPFVGTVCCLPEKLDSKLDLALGVCLPARLQENAERRAGWVVVVALLEHRVVGDIERVQTGLQRQPLIQLEILRQIRVDVPI